MSRTLHHVGQRKRRQYTDPRPLRREREQPLMLTASFLVIDARVASIEAKQHVEAIPNGRRVSENAVIGYEADDHAPGCTHHFRRNFFTME